MPEQITFFSAWYCPFAQRTWATLEHLGIPYDYLEVDPYHKSPEWLEISRGTGQVPVLEVRNIGERLARFPDSLRTMEYLSDTQTIDHQLLPSDAIDRARARFWLDHQGNAILPFFYRFLKASTGSENANEARDQMLSGLLKLIQGMDQTGPYFMGRKPGMVDFAFAPFALRIEHLLSHYRKFSLPTEGAAWERYHIWFQAISTHPAFQKTMPDHDTYLARLTEFYLPYSLGGGQDDVTKIA
jgi:glutathione S-transferase